MFDLTNKVAFITGGSIGIGAKVIECLLKENVKQVVNLDIAEDKGIALQNELNKKYGDNKVKFIKGDVTNDADLDRVYDTVLKEQGYVDVVINNAGIMNDSMEKYKKQIEINVTALTSNTFKAIAVMRKDKGGKGGVILNVSSIAAFIQSDMLPVYGGTKSAVLQFSNSIGLPEHYTKTGVRVITICFGPTDTSLLSREKMGQHDKAIDDAFMDSLTQYQYQKPESAALAVVEAIKQGESGSTWLSKLDKPAEDVTAVVKKAYALLTEISF